MRILFCLVTLVSMFLAAESNAYGQHALYNDDPNIGSGTYRPFTARTYQEHAINHAQILRHYGKTVQSLDAGTAKEHAVEVRKNLDKSFAELEKANTLVKNDPEAKALLASIVAHQKKADEICGQLEAECLKKAADGVVVADCCTGMLQELNAAYADHDKLMKHLGITLPLKK